MNINQFMNNTEKPFHSSGYADVANGGAFGSVSAQSFEQRARIERNRQSVRRYHDSHIGRGSLQFRPEISLPQRTVGVPTAVPRRNVPSRRRFIEPPARSYNPYE